MRLWVLITLLLLLPLQWVAAAQAGICGPRCGCASENTPNRHGAPDTRPDASDGLPATQEVVDALAVVQAGSAETSTHPEGACASDAATPASQTPCDGECASCHAAVMNALVGGAQLANPVHGGELGRSAYCRHIAPHAPERPFRPPTSGA